jgi:hypothetical protein
MSSSLLPRIAPDCSGRAQSVHAGAASTSAPRGGTRNTGQQGDARFSQVFFRDEVGKAFPRTRCGGCRGPTLPEP